MEGQGPGDGHPLLLAAGELTGVVVRAVTQTHLGQQLPALGLDLLQDLLPVGFEVGPFLAEELLGQGDVPQGGVLGEQVEGLEHQAEMEPLFPHLALPLGGGIVGVEQSVPLDDDLPLVGGLQKVQAPQQGGLAAAGGADDGQSLALLQVKADVLQHPGRAKVLFNMMYFGMFAPPYTRK